MKRTLSFILVTAMLATCFMFFNVSAEESDFSYTIDDVTMTISGNGAVPDNFYYDLGYETRESIHHVVIEEGITEIGDHAFSYFYALESVSLPDTLERIGVSAFAVCRSLNNVTLPEGLKSIDDYAFYNCRSITEMVIPESVTYLGEHIFDYAMGLSYVKLPSHLTILPAATFHHCESLKEIELPAGITEMGDSVFSYSAIESIVIPSGVTLIPERAFEECLYLESVTLSDKIEKIDKYAFYHTPSLKGIDLPESLRVIEYAAFNRSGLEGELVIPDGVEEMYWKTFYDTDITKLSLPSTLKYMEYAIFGMTPLTEIAVDEDNPVYTSYEGCLYSKDMTVLYMYTNGDGKSEFTVPETVEFIDGYCFGGNNNIEKIYLPFGIRKIHNEALADREYYAVRYPYYCYEGTPAHQLFKDWYIDGKVGYLEIQDISVSQMPDQTEYLIAEHFKPEGLSVCVTDAFGEKSYFDGDFEVGEYDFSSAGETSVPVSLWGYTVEVPVTVIPDASPIPESMHPYESNFDRTWVYTHPTQCDKLRITFSEESFTEGGYDVIYIYDTEGELVGEYSGGVLSGLVLDIPGNGFSLRFVSDGSTQYYGFSIVSIEPLHEPKTSVDNYTATLTDIKDIKEIRFAIGHYTTGSEVKAAEKNVTLDASTVKKYTADGIMTYDLPWMGEYTFWIRYNDGSQYFVYTNIEDITPYVESYGVKITVKDYAENYKDMWLAEGTFNSYNEIKTSTAFKYQASKNKLDLYAKTTHDFSYTMTNPGTYTVLIRYNDGTFDVIHHELKVDTPVFTPNGLQMTVSNIPDIKIIRTAPGEHNSVAELKAASGVRNFSNKNDIKNAEEYTIQYRKEGWVTIIVEYNNGYKHIHHHCVEPKVPTMEQNGNTVTFGNLDGLVMVRYAKGEYTTSSQIKKAPGSKFIKPDEITDGKISVTLEKGIYTFCVQYDDDSYNYYNVTV